MNDTFFCGAVSGFFQTIIGHPLDTIKTLKQNNISITKTNLMPSNLYRGIRYPLTLSPILIGTTFYLNDNFRYYKKYGINYFITGFITSFIICPFDEFKIKRQIGKNFNLFDFFKCYSNITTVLLREIPAIFIYFNTYDYFRTNKYSTISSGAISGISMWFFIYPIDTIKTQIHANGLNNFKLVLDRRLFNGLTICLIRAGLVNSVGFYIYEFLKNKK